MRVTVYHNCARDDDGRPVAFLDGYQPDHAVTPVADLNVPGPADRSDVLDRMYFLFNVGDDPDFGTPNAMAVEYRKRENRSLSIGDVVCVDDEWFACADSGWTPVARPQITHTTLHGTTPLEGVDA